MQHEPDLDGLWAFVRGQDGGLENGDEDGEEEDGVGGMVVRGGFWIQGVADPGGDELEVDAEADAESVEVGVAGKGPAGLGGGRGVGEMHGVVGDGRFCCGDGSGWPV